MFLTANGTPGPGSLPRFPGLAVGACRLLANTAQSCHLSDTEAPGRAPRASPRLRSKCEKSKLLWTEADFSDLMGQGPEGCCHQSPWSLLACAGLRGLPRAVRSPTTAWGTDVTAGPPATTACGTQGGDSTPGGLPSPATRHPQRIPRHAGWGWGAFHLSGA